MLSSKLVPLKDIVYTDFQGTGGILVDLNTKQYYQLNETGSLIWRALEKEIPLKTSFQRCDPFMKYQKSAPTRVWKSFCQPRVI
jgi:hypothetical protein